ncbi:Arylsulfatase [Hondaea fermentalgiana]|uniref:Arylsulfatase n=1 Tax=Hondaea fermentalgiana TaxID=2315210 RepID=A0A2R5GQS2_9STRA|nr:Arylsulfatase [Hondaea fermentalgiana]|eukprot:GBG32108.1 Arylsulfatase [Hondaea fermentalgiana]
MAQILRDVYIGVMLALALKTATSVAAPNIVVFYADDQGNGDQPFANPDILEMPNYRRIVDAGMTFTDGHSASAVCTPSRYGLLAGRNSHRALARGGVLQRVDRNPVFDEEERNRTLPAMLSRAGYGTYMVGKWHLGQDIQGKRYNRDFSEAIRMGPHDVGFDHSFWVLTSANGPFQAYIEDDMCTEPANLYTRKTKVPGGIVVKADQSVQTTTFQQPYQDPSTVPKPKLEKGIEIAANFRTPYLMSNLTEHALGYIEYHLDTRPLDPFFLYFAATTPHLPVTAHPDFAGQSSYGLWADMFTELDFRVGEILDALEAHNVHENTLFIWTSDNGPESIYRKLLNTGYDAQNGLTGSKRSIYEGGHRVPMIMQWPDAIAAGSISDLPVSQVDFFATFAELAGASYDGSIMGQDSISFAPELRGAAGGVRHLSPLVAESKSATISLRAGELKFIPEKQMCFNLTADLTESRNLWKTIKKDYQRKLKSIVISLEKDELFLNEMASLKAYQDLLTEDIFK